MFDFNIFTTEFEEKNRQYQMRIPKLISSNLIKPKKVGKSFISCQRMQLSTQAAVSYGQHRGHTIVDPFFLDISVLSLLSW